MLNPIFIKFSSVFIIQYNNSTVNYFLKNYLTTNSSKICKRLKLTQIEMLLNNQTFTVLLKSYSASNRRLDNFITQITQLKPNNLYAAMILVIFDNWKLSGKRCTKQTQWPNVMNMNHRVSIVSCVKHTYLPIVTTCTKATIITWFRSALRT